MANITWPEQTWPEHEWRSVMNNWLLESKEALDPDEIFTDDEYGLLNAAKFAMLVFINKNTSSSNSASSGNSTSNETEKYSDGLFSEFEERNDTRDVNNRTSLQNIGKVMSL